MTPPGVFDFIKCATENSELPVVTPWPAGFDRCSSRKTGQFGPSRAPLPGRLPRPNGPVELQPEQHLPPASLLAEVHQLQDRRCARCPATDPSAQSRRGARGLCCRYHCCARNTYSVRRDPGSLPHPTTVPRNLPLHPRSSSRGSTFPKLTCSWPFAA